MHDMPVRVVSWSLFKCHTGMDYGYMPTGHWNYGERAHNWLVKFASNYWPVAGFQPNRVTVGEQCARVALPVNAGTLI
jgi:hypothetical protein